MICNAARVLEVSPRQVERLLEKHRAHGNSGLLPSEKRGGKGIHRIDELVDELMDKIIKENYLTNQKKSVAEIYRMLTKAINELNETRSEREQLQLPDVGTLYNRINEIDRRSKTAAREGARLADNNFAIFGGEFNEGKSPLQLVETDQTKLDFTIVDSELRRPLGRLFITGMVDIFSTCIPSYYLGLKQSTANEVGITIMKCAMEKSEEVLKHGISEWPIQGIPKAIHFDNAKEYRANLIVTGCTEWGIHVIHRPLMNPRFGGQIERLFRTFQQFAHSLPGTTKSNPQDKGDYNSENESCLTFDEAETLVLKFIDKYHHRPRADLGGLTPLEKWNEGIKDHGMPRQLAKEDEQKFRISFLPAEKRTIQKDGLHFAGLKYFSDKLTKFTRQDNRGNSIEQIIRFDPFDIRRIWIFDAEENKYYMISATDNSVAASPEPISLRRWHSSRGRLRRRGIGTPSSEIVLMQYRQMQEIIENAANSTKIARRKEAIAEREKEVGKRFNRTLVQNASPSEEAAEEFEPPTKDHHSKIRTSFRRPQEHP
jgi:putative transposase